QHVHLGHLLAQRTARKLDPEWVDDDLAVLVVQPFRARILVALVAEDAVVDLAGPFAGVHARVGHLEAVAAAQTPFGADQRLRQPRLRTLHLDQVKRLDVLGEPEDHPAAISAIVDARRAPALQRIADRGLGAGGCRRRAVGALARLAVARFIGQRAEAEGLGLLSIEQRAARPGNGQLTITRRGP